MQPSLALFGQPQKGSNFFLGGLRPPRPPFKSAAVAASARQVRTLELSRPLSRPPWVGRTWSMVWNVDYRTARSSPAFARNAKSGFLSTLFVEFPGNASNFVGSAGSTLFEQFPGNAANFVQKKVPEWGPEKSSGIGRPGWEVQASSCLSRPCSGPDQISKPGQKHQKWSERGPESTVLAENRST